MMEEKLCCESGHKRCHTHVDKILKRRTALDVIMVPLGTDIIKRRKALEPSCLELLGGYLSVSVLIHQLQDGVDDIICLFLMFYLVLEGME